jgi:hypothetical protein
MSSSKGWSKVLNTCGPHKITVVISYASGLFSHIKPSSSGATDQGNFFSCFMVAYIEPPLVYSFRNSNVKLAPKRALSWFTQTGEPVGILWFLAPLLILSLYFLFFLMTILLLFFSSLYFSFNSMGNISTEKTFSPLFTQCYCVVLILILRTSQSQGSSILVFIFCAKWRSRAGNLFLLKVTLYIQIYVQICMYKNIFSSQEKISTQVISDKIVYFLPF